MRWSLALLALLALLAILPVASAARTETVVTTFSDARTMDVIVEVVATGPEARALREGMDLNHNGVVDGLDLEWDNRCQYAIPSMRVSYHLDSYAMTPAFVACDHESARGAVDADTEVRVRKTLRAVTPLPEARMLVAELNGPLAVSFGAPPGKEILQSGDASLRAIGTTQLAGEIVPGIPRYAVLRFPYAGQPLDFGYSESKQHTVTLLEPDLIRQEHEIVHMGSAAERSRARLDANADGVVNESEVNAARDVSRLSPDSIMVDGVDRPGQIVSIDVTGAMGPVTYQGSVVWTYRHESQTTLPRDGFRLRDYADSDTVWIFRAPHGRTLAAASGLEAVQVVDEGQRLYGAARSGTFVEVDVSRTLVTPATGATEPEALPAGDWTRTTAVSLSAGEPALMRWSISDVRTGAVARDFRASLDSDADNQVSADEVASHEAGMRLVPAPAAWPFTLDGAAPTSTRVYSVEITGLAGPYNDPDAVRSTVTYEANYGASTGLLRAAALDYGDRIGISGPHGEPLDAAGATGLRDVVAGLDGSTLQAVPLPDGWSVRIGAPPAAPTPATPTASGATPAPAPACAAPSEEGALSTTWTVTFSAPERAGIRIEQTASGARAAASRAIVDTNDDCAVSQAEADAAAAANARAELFGSLAALEGATPVSVGTPLASLEGYVGAANRADPAVFSRSFVATFEATPPALLELTAQGARVIVVPPAGHVVEAVDGFADVTVTDGRLQGDALRDAATVRVRILPAAIESAVESPTIAELAPRAEETASEGAATEGAPTDGAPVEDTPSSPSSEATGGTDAAGGTDVASPSPPATPAPTASGGTRTPAATPTASPTTASQPGAAPGAIVTPGARTPGPSLAVVMVALAALALARKR